MLGALSAAALVSAGFGGAESWFAPDADLWPRWQTHRAGNKATIDHGAWDALLKRYLSNGRAGLNEFNYGRVTPADRQKLNAYVSNLVGVRISAYDRGEQLPYWINLYNALTVRLILDNYPVKSIQDIDISPGLFTSGPWDKKLIEVEGEALSLNDIEHRILRPIWRDPRIHYGVNCASVGCPNLRREAYTAANVDALLTQGARDYVNSPRGVSVSGNQVTVSKIYDWFKEDFGNSEQGVLRHVSQYARPDLRQQLARIGKISDVAYDWSLNGS